jgi:hypothetical protein
MHLYVRSRVVIQDSKRLSASICSHFQEQLQIPGVVSVVYLARFEMPVTARSSMTMPAQSLPDTRKGHVDGRGGYRPNQERICVHRAGVH